MSDDIGASLDRCMLKVDALHTRIRELEAQIETLSIELAISRLAENRERERAEKAEAELAVAKRMMDRDAADYDELKAERDEYKSQAEWNGKAYDHNKKALEAAMKERCAKEAEGLAESISGAECERVCYIIAYLIRALKPSGDPCGGQAEKPVNPYLLGGSSTQSEG